MLRRAGASRLRLARLLPTDVWPVLFGLLPPPAPSAAHEVSQGKGDGGAPGKGAGKGKGKGKGANSGNAPPRPQQPVAPSSQDGDWSVVTRRQEPTAEVELRQQDWDSEIVRYEVLASKLEACQGVFKAVIRCGKGQLSTARTLLQESPTVCC